jgi:serine/threonine-protein kinase
MGLGILTQMSRLIGDGATIKQLLGGRVLPEADTSRPEFAFDLPPVGPSAAALPAPRADQNDGLRRGPYGAVLGQAMTDRQTVNDLLGRLTETERAMLPEMKETADALFQRIVALAGALTRLGTEADPARVASLDERIAELEKAGGEAGDRERRRNLLKRQRDSLNELVTRRDALLEQYESAGLLLQNMALDLLKVRSSGLDSAINGLTSATQEARALSKEIGYVLAAGEELRGL